MKNCWKLHAVVATLALASVIAWAQPPGGSKSESKGGTSGFGHGPRGMGMGMRRFPQMQLGRFVMGVGLLEKNGKNKLSAAQAKKIVGAISPWRKKPGMTASQASALNTKLTAVLTSTQKKELEGMRPSRRGAGAPEGRGEWRRGEGGGEHSGGWGGGPDGHRGTPPTEAQRQQMRARMEKMRKFFATYNPFYPPTKYSQYKEIPERMRQGIKRRFDAQEALLNQLAKKAAKA
jgi:hypothetical protein